MEKTTKQIEESKTVETQKTVEVEKPKEEKQNTVVTTPTATSSSSTLTIIIIVIIFLALLIGGIILGLNTERTYGTTLLKKLPKNIVTKWLINEPVLPTPMIALEFKPSPIHTPEPSGSPLLTEPTPTLSEEPTPPSDQQNTDSGYILPFSNTKKVVTEDLTDLTPWELKVARNEIYARYGRPFVHKDLSCYFAKQAWYTMDPAYTDKSLSSLETTNAVFILNYENQIDSPLVNKDSGCN